MERMIKITQFDEKKFEEFLDEHNEKIIFCARMDKIEGLPSIGKLARNTLPYKLIVAKLVNNRWHWVDLFQNDVKLELIKLLYDTKKKKPRYDNFIYFVVDTITLDELKPLENAKKYLTQKQYFEEASELRTLIDKVKKYVKKENGMTTEEKIYEVVVKNSADGWEMSPASVNVKVKKTVSRKAIKDKGVKK